MKLGMPCQDAAAAACASERDGARCTRDERARGVSLRLYSAAEIALEWHLGVCPAARQRHSGGRREAGWHVDWRAPSGGGRDAHAERA